MRRAFAVLVAVLAAVAVAVTAAPLLTSDAWWIRMWEFPRLHVLVAAIAIALLGVVTLRGPVRLAALATMVAVAVWQGQWVWPYAPWAAADVALRPAGDDAPALAIALNVRMDNADHVRIRDYLVARDPDLLLLMETDAAWAAALASVLDRYHTRVERIADDHYGMILVTRLPTRTARIGTLPGDETPIALAELDGPGGRFLFAGLHPRPPVPGTATRDRDDQMAAAAGLARAHPIPALAMGDFNDVGWSRAAQRFRDVGGYLDPRIGRGLMPSFDAESWLLRFPIDQGLVTDGIVLHDFALGPHVGSDHFPIEMTFSIAAGATPARAPSGRDAEQVATRSR